MAFMIIMTLVILGIGFILYRWIKLLCNHWNSSYDSEISEESMEILAKAEAENQKSE